MAKTVCDGVSDGPPERPVPHKVKKIKVILGGLDSADDSDPLLRDNIENDEVRIKFTTTLKNSQHVLLTRSIVFIINVEINVIVTCKNTIL